MGFSGYFILIRVCGVNHTKFMAKKKKKKKQTGVSDMKTRASECLTKDSDMETRASECPTKVSDSIAKQEFAYGMANMG